ncbi:hypothetical protein LX32DRAFT_399818 [Colletotrichum zoysiae]|uniref:Uncharacterized protein n=1 Tax=Colletotrichum zoysiae TaxID=1216348 RepID=A0AAD9HGL2_9PEZI|nr:hypothetical protein LX32DRAFT_399818 [Colletotrichum zoysiae]
MRQPSKAMQSTSRRNATPGTKQDVCAPCIRLCCRTMGRPPVEKTTGRTWESLDSKHRILPLSDKADRRRQFGVVLSIIISFHAFQLALASVFSNCVY